MGGSDTGCNMRPQRVPQSTRSTPYPGLRGKDGSERLCGCLKHAECRVERTIYDLYVLQALLRECSAQALIPRSNVCVTSARSSASVLTAVYPQSFGAVGCRQ